MIGTKTNSKCSTSKWGATIQAIGDQMKDRHLSEQSIDELWALHEEVIRILSSKMADEKALLEKRLKELQQSAARSAERAKRPYPPVHPKYRNPARPSETWAGRGKQPRWVSAALKRGKRLEDLRITA
jgi:DNA-binding protein H-NS